MGKVTAIIQARMGSTRLLGKVLMDIAGHPMLWHVIHRVKAAKLLDNVVVATTVRREDLAIQKLAAECGVDCYTGSTLDVLARYISAADTFNADPIVRITADCPLIDPVIIDRAVLAYLTSKEDYTGLDANFPEGFDVEVFSRFALLRALRRTPSDYDREHVTPYIKRNFKCGRVRCNIDYSKYRTSVDTQEDMDKMQWIYSKLYQEGEIFHMEDVIGLLNSQSESTV